MNPNEQKEEKPKEDLTPTTQAPTTKLQRKLKFKTLDGNIKHLECDYDIKISELKKKLAEIYKIEPIRQRLLNKGKQFKDDEYLDKLVDKDDTTIHLVFRSEEDVKRLQENAKNNNNQNTNTNQNTQNINPFQNIISVVTNSDQLRNLTNNIVNQFFSAQGNNTNNNTNNTNNTTDNNRNINNNTNSLNIQTTTRYQTLNLGEALNLNTSPLQAAQPITNIQNPPSLNLNNNNTNINVDQNSINERDKNLYSSQFPIAYAQTDKKYEMHLKNIEKELDEADKIMSQDIEPKIPLPLLNTTQNVFTAISRSIRKYVIINQNILSHLMRLADLMEREQYITQSEVRMTGNKLLDQAYKSLAHISKASNDLSNVIKSSNFNTAPNTGYIGIICQEIGMQSTSIPVGVGMGDLNSNSILSALRGRTNNNRNPNNLTTTINLNNLINNNNNNNQNQPNLNGATITSIPISISVIDSSEPPLINNNDNLNNNIRSNNIQQTTGNTTSSANVTNNEESNKDKNDKNDNKEEQNKPKEKEENANNTNNNPINPPNNINNNSNNININVTTQQNNNNNNNQNINNQNNNNNFNNLLGNMMNQLMTPENINSISEAVDSMMNNNQGNLNLGNLIGNLMNSLDLNELDGNPTQQNRNPSPQPPQSPQPSSVPPSTPQKNENEVKSENQNNSTPQNNTNINKNINNINSSDPIFKQLVENILLRKEIKVGDEKKIGEEMAPNIEFVTFSNDIIRDLTIQEIFDMYNFNFKGLCRLRKDINSKYFNDKSKNDEVIKNIIELLCERFILIENQIDKLIPGKEFILEDFFTKELKKVLIMFIDEKELNLTDKEWEQKFRKLVIDMLKELIKEIKNLYETGEEGSKYFLEFNIITLIENFIGTKYLNAIQNYDDNLFTNFVENIFNIIKAEEIINKCDNTNSNSDKNKVNEEKKNEKDKKEEKEEKNMERPNVLSIDEIFKIANKDKERLEKEEKDKNGNNTGNINNNNNKKYSDFYNLTSLFKS